MVVRNTLRSPRHFILSAFGIVIGIGAFVLFLALTQRAGETLEKVFPLNEVEVVAPRVAVGTVDASKHLDNDVVKTIATRPEVASAVPRLNLAFPSAGRGSFEGTDLKFEVGGFADGVDASFVQDDDRIKELFKDWDALPNDPNRIACEPPPPDPEGDILQSPRAPKKSKIPLAPASPPAAGSGSASGSAAGSGSNVAAGSGAGSGSGSAVVIVQTPPPKQTYFNPCPNPDRYYCDDTERMCKHRVPVVMSSTVVELYNNQFAKSHGMPMADENLVNFLIQTRGLSAMRFSIGLNATTVAGSRMAKKQWRRVEAVVVGVSSRAMRIGVTMPIQYIERWNKEFVNEDAASNFSSIIVKLKDRNQLAPFSSWLVDKQGLRLEDSQGERFATVIFVIRLLFLIISIAILVISIINIGHNFFIQVSERKREIGIMRAVGATETDVQLIVLGEAALIGIVGGLIGVGLAWAIGATWNYYAASAIPRFPFKPDSWFDFKTWIWGSALGFSTLFCILGGYLPARRAAKMPPASALAQQ
ncbi:MAG TPA: ABC transporter permease [Kofleriaceae bacterium]